MTQDTFDVIIVGAGIAGLSAALELKEENKKFLLLEARERVGGRSNSQITEEGNLIELGGQWIGSNQPRISKLVDKYNLKKFKTPVFEGGKSIIHYKGNVYDFSDYQSISPSISLLLKEIQRLSQTINVKEPFHSSNAVEFDHISFEEWVNHFDYDDFSKDLIKIIIPFFMSNDLKTISLLHVLFYIATTGGLEAFFTLEGGAQNYRIFGGTNLLMNRMADDIGRENILLSNPVFKVHFDSKQVEVFTKDTSFKAKYVILAIPPTLASQINYSPDLPPLKKQALGSFNSGQAIKLNFVYETPFWREDSQIGYVINDGILQEILDNSIPSSSNFSLCAFVYGKESLKFKKMDPIQRKESALQDLNKIFGEKALNVKHYLEGDFSREEWSAGCFSEHPSIGSSTKVGEFLRSNVDNIYFCATEYASSWCGYFEGGIASALEATQNILSKLKTKI
jgi:monoamine oxidase